VSKTYQVSRLPFGRKTVYTALSGISLNIMRGEVFALLGPNGAGKTTLIKIICGLIRPTEGSVKINGHDALRDEVEAKKSIGCCLESERSFYYRISGRQNLAFFASLDNLKRKEAAEKAGALLKVLDLDSVADTPFMHYSSGQRQRLNLARALLKDPSIIILDEPTKSLDPGAAENFWKVLKEWVANEPERTVLFSTHSLEEAERFGTSLAFLDEGKVKAHGSLQEIRRRFKQESLRAVYRQVIDKGGLD
jgi:ABC-2 type transport system ATP-binding protein